MVKSDEENEMYSPISTHHSTISLTDSLFVCLHNSSGRMSNPTAASVAVAATASATNNIMTTTLEGGGGGGGLGGNQPHFLRKSSSAAVVVPSSTNATATMDWLSSSAGSTTGPGGGGGFLSSSITGGPLMESSCASEIGSGRISTGSAAISSDIRQHLQSMFHVLRPEETLKMVSREGE